ncbi:MAG: outer membrane beta-barrel domain-containing protein [Gammaproteobacteria bacterium]|nr:outer membrane beta-barrel domain-containing protein [Gammaproteobacteria bacterium]
MAGRILLFLLKVLIASSATLIFVQNPAIAIEETSPLINQSEQLIQPEIQRREVKLATIDSENFEITGFFGVLSVEDFGTNSVIGARLAYHINEDLFVEVSLGSSEAGKTSYERLSGGPGLLTDKERDILYYNISLGFNLLPGEAFLTQKTSFNTALYIIGGIGNTEFGGSDRLTLNLGGGFRLLATDWLAYHIDVRDHIFNIDMLGEDKTTNNLEVTFGLSAFF